MVHSEKAAELEAQSVTKIFTRSGGIFGKKREITAVDDVSFTLRQGETLAIVGESGSGKSTTGRILADLLQASSGTVLYNGEDLRSLSKPEYSEYRRAVQVIFQDPAGSFNPRRNIRSTLESVIRLHHVVPKQQTESFIIELLERVELKPGRDYIDRYPHELSGGQRQRLAIARAIAISPKFIVADEALSALDVSIARRVLVLLAQLQQEENLGFAFITHDLAVAKNFADTVIVMKNGRIVESGSAHQVLSDPQEAYTRELIAAHPIPDPRARRFHSSSLVTDLPGHERKE